jgi:HEPN domain-containing protein
MRNRDQTIFDFVQQWIKKAESDLKAAEILLRADVDDCFLSAFHSQQAAEKFLKAYLIRHQLEFRKTHDLEELISLVDPTDPSLRHEIGSCVWLTPYGVEFRYPGEYPVVDRPTGEKAYDESEAVQVAVMKRLEDYLSQGRPG